MQHLLTKLTPYDNIEAYFEKTAEQEGWLHHEWSGILVSLLSVEAQHAYFLLFDEDAHNYDLLKIEIVAHCKVSST